MEMIQGDLVYDEGFQKQIWIISLCSIHLVLINSCSSFINVIINLGWALTEAKDDQGAAVVVAAVGAAVGFGVVEAQQRPNRGQQYRSLT